MASLNRVAPNKAILNIPDPSSPDERSTPNPPLQIRVPSSSRLNRENHLLLRDYCEVKQDFKQRVVVRDSRWM